MSSEAHTGSDVSLVAAQIGRAPREPWRVRTRCKWGHPSVIVSPSTLGDGTPFPTLAWLTCPWLAEEVSALESAGGVSRWRSCVAADQAITDELLEADAALREARARESSGRDECAGVGIAGQSDPLQVKCLHTHVALALMDIADPVGRGVLAEVGDACPDERCARLVLTMAEGLR